MSTTISTAQITEGTKEGVGVFDVLMRSVNAQITGEYSSGRITGAEYAQVYLGTMQTAMQQAMQFVLTKQRAEHEADLMALQVTTESLNQALISQQTINAAKEADKIVAEKCLLDAQYDNAINQGLRIVAETALLGQKKVTEQAQVNAVSVDVDSVIGRQKALYAAQTNGYSRDAEQKTAKILADAFAVQITTAGASAAGTGLDAPHVLSAVTKMLEGVEAV
jgi:hypothetical protein